MKINYADQTYIVNNRSGFDLTTALRLWKTKYADDYRDFQKDVITHPSLNDFDQFVQECWSKIKPVTVEEALKLENTEERRTYFDAIGIEKLFKELKPTLLDKQVVKKKRQRWDEEFKEYTHEFEDVYELYKIDGNTIKQEDYFHGNHGFTIGFHPIRPDQVFDFTDISRIFKLIRKYR